MEFELSWRHYLYIHIAWGLLIHYCSMVGYNRFGVYRFQIIFLFLARLVAALPIFLLTILYSVAFGFVVGIVLPIITLVSSWTLPRLEVRTIPRFPLWVPAQMIYISENPLDLFGIWFRAAHSKNKNTGTTGIGPG